MRKSGMYRRQSGSSGLLVMLFALLLWQPHAALAHGGVAFEEDQCVISIDFLTAHFTVYQPEYRGSEEFCEDLPDVTNTLFVMEYLHDFLREMPVDFRIIEDREDFGIYARWEDVATIEDIDAVTVFYRPPEIRPQGELTAEYRFQEKGTYIGIVTAEHPDDERVYRAVFYFQVGGPDYGTLPLFLVLVLLLQGAYWLSNGGWRRLRS